MNSRSFFQLALRTAIFAAATVAIAAALTGCGTATPTSVTPPTPPTPTVKNGIVNDGQSLVSGATIQLYAVGNTGVGSAATPLLTQTVTTDSAGTFTLAGLWSCTNTSAYGTDPLLYLTATGGNPGLVSGTNNTALVMIAAVGRCSTFTSTSYVYVNEVSTVAAVYALAPFMIDLTHVGATSALMTGLSNAFATINGLVDPATGLAPGPGAPSGAVLPTSTINTLANAIAGCAHSTGSGAPCSTLFSAATPSGGTAPTDITTALLRIAAAPSRNVSVIYTLAAATSSFSPKLSATPNDWTLAVTCSGNGISGPSGVAMDAAGNAWIANGSGAGVTALSPQGAALTGAAPYTASSSIYGAQGVAVDRSGNVWVADTLLSKVVKLAISGNAVSSNTAFTTGFSGPGSIAVDGGNRIWVANFGDGSITALSNTGTLLNSSPITNGSLVAPAAVAMDVNSNVWVTDNGSSTVFKFDNTGNLLSSPSFTDGALLAPAGTALDATGRAWVADNGNSAISVFAADGSSPIATPVTGSGIVSPTAIAIDGSGTAWIASGATTGNLTKLASPSAPPTGGLGTLNAPAALAVDSSGNLWTANSGDNTVTKFIGLAVPVVTPIAANLTARP
jgi:DNA-binding beta-propeller fold protein YncE